MVDRQALGRWGEQLAAAYLRRRGYRILDRNFRCPLGEIDMVAEENGQLVFIEVKTRSSNRFGYPQEAVTPTKQRRLVRLANYYLVSKGLTDLSCRFDVVAVAVKDGQGRVEVFPGAFSQ